jgi:membrane protein DedA with SNARE-associated domain
MTDLFIELIKEYGYIILFLWSILEGEMGLIMGGLLSHTGDMWYPLAIFVAGLGGFAGDQIYFYIGRFNKKYIHTKLRKQRRKFAVAHILLKNHGWPIIFFQRYMYGLRTVIPMSIGLTRYSAKKFAIINLLSAWAWAAITITPAYILGDEILEILDYAHEHWYFAIPIALTFAGVIFYAFNTIEKNILKKRTNENRNIK